MACFWQGIINLLDLSEMNLIFKTNFHRKPLPKKFIKFLIKNNIHINDIKHNNKNLSANEILENYEHIKLINYKKIGNGYLCSTSDPILFLICHLFEYNIKHDFCGTEIFYDHPNPKGLLIFGSNSTHFYSVDKILY